MHSHQFQWLVPPEGLFWHSGTTLRDRNVPHAVNLALLWSCSSLELVAEAENYCSAPITCPCPRGSAVSQLRWAEAALLEPRQNSPSGSHADNRSASDLTNVNVARYTQHSQASTAGCDSASITCGALWPLRRTLVSWQLCYLIFNSMQSVDELAQKQSHLRQFSFSSICVAHAKWASDVIVQ